MSMSKGPLDVKNSPDYFVHQLNVSQKQIEFSANLPEKSKEKVDNPSTGEDEVQWNPIQC